MSRELWIGLLMLFCSSVGFITNWMIVVLIYQTTRLKQPFAILTVALAVIDATFSTLYLFYATPMVLFVLFTKYITLCVLIYTCIIITLFFGILGCENYYNPAVVAFSYSRQPICSVFAFYGDFCEVLILTVAGAAMDLITIWKVLKMRIRTERGQKDLNFLKQSLSQTFFVLTIVICFTWGPKLTTGNDLTFLFSSILWSAVHCFDGVFTLIFNGEVRQKLKTGSQVRSSFVSGAKSFF
ncbi:hypothetical protein B9Z55_018649 [Caenorhabditis nigoni]|uniref:7TM GPCR serpentine receptor class x (Srx) domain-containing protein n=1 Tax=Caenorhabditis nigoni TaxID=1611254 RepID=A0A2G5TFU0_9PELO|nr:hypothetical protein B9Z55_018649 [Caenorhabditis nigoni]